MLKRQNTVIIQKGNKDYLIVNCCVCIIHICIYQCRRLYAYTRAFIFKTNVFLESSLFWRLWNEAGVYLLRVNNRDQNIFARILRKRVKRKKNKCLKYSHFSGTATSRCVLRMSVNGGENKHGLSLEATQQLETAATLINSIITVCTQCWAIWWCFFLRVNIVQIDSDSPSETKFVLSYICNAEIINFVTSISWRLFIASLMLTKEI